MLPRTLALRDGRPIVVRHATAEDVAALALLDVAIVADGRGAVRLPSDLPPAHLAEERLRGSLAQLAEQHGAQLLAETAGRVIGQASIERYRPSLLAHTAIFTLDVHPDVQRLGIGRALARAALDWADETTPAIERVELCVRADNERAIALYRSLGFVHEGTRRRFVRLPDGQYVDDLGMARLRD
jgi:putative acetyltransferase